ncbi:MAG: DUF4215 domain-containing protein [Candidatus Falkowbacteria bacterium]
MHDSYSPNLLSSRQIAPNYAFHYAPNFLNTRKGKIYKAINVFSMSLLVLNMSFGMALGGIFMVAPGEALACHGNITIKKVTNPSESGSGKTSFNFIGGLGSFILTDGGTKNAYVTGDRKYTITEEARAGWTLTNIVCTGDAEAVIDIPNRKVVIDLDDKENVFCTFTNKKDGDECKEKLGDDYFTVAKWEWSGDWNEDISKHNSDYTTAVTGNTASASWTSNPAVAKVLRKAATNYTEFPGGTSGTVVKGAYDISHLTFCGGPECKLKLTKTDNPDPVSPGGNLSYVLTLENIGTADCTGSGVILKEYYSSQTVFTSSNPVPTSGNNEWVYDVLHPGETRVIEILTSVKTDTACGSTLLNKACVTANELPAALCEEETTEVFCAPPVCGDGTVNQVSEECDDGNDIDNDDCRNNCTEPECGDGITDTDEICDDNGQNGVQCVPAYGGSCTYCSNICQPMTLTGPFCGDGVQNGTEICDFNDPTHAGVPEHYTCNNNCETTYVPYCGDGNPDNGEVCDDGVNNGRQCVPAYGGNCTYCSGICSEITLTGPFCGDGVQNGTEICDFNDPTNAGVPEHNICNLSCDLTYIPYCGDGIKNGTEICDFNDPTNAGVPEHYTCDNNCETNYVPYCGDGNIDSGEQCDDHNNIDGDGCDANCQNEDDGPICGDGLINQSWEQCDGLTGVGPHQTCSADCVLENVPYCGDGNIDTGEQCDDHNSIDGDGCDANCAIETGSLTICKYYDNGLLGIYEHATDTPLTWNFLVTKPDLTNVDAATNGETACVTLDGLVYGDYTVAEMPLVGGNWVNSYPYGGAHQVTVGAVSLEPLIFLNYQTPEPRCGDGTVNVLDEECDDGNTDNADGCHNDCTLPKCGDGISGNTPGEQCDDGNNVSGDGCSATCTTEGGGGPYCGDGIVQTNRGEQCDDANSNNNDSCKNDCTTPGGGGGGGGHVFLDIMEIEAKCIDENTAKIEWRTNKTVTSWVVYGLDSDDIKDATSTDTTTESTLHSTTIGGLKPYTEYSFTAKAEEGSDKAEKTVKYKTDACVEVKGEEGDPILSITKVIPDEKSFYNPGDKNFKYVINYANTGNLTAFNVIIKDILPEGIVYADTASTTREWAIGDLLPGETGEITYLANVIDDAAEKIYVNTATIRSDNHKQLEAMADLEVREIEVLAETGWSVFEFMALIMMVGGLTGASALLKRKAYNA